MPSENFRTRLTNYLDAGYVLLSVESHEELRVIAEIRAIVRQRKTTTKEDKEVPVAYGEWDIVGGLERISWKKNGELEVAPVNGTKEPLVMLDQVKAIEHAGVFVIKDIHPVIESASIWRKIRNLIGAFKDHGTTLIMLSPRPKIPSELSKEVQSVEFGLPSRVDLRNLFEAFVENSIKSKPAYKDIELTEGYIDTVAESAMGMTEMEADNGFGLATIAINRARKKVELDEEFPRRVFEEKISTLKSSALEYMPTTTGFEMIGGMESLKQWAMLRRRGFDDDARKLRLPYPKGTLLAGIKGVGKTVTAMAIAKEFGFPLFRLDVGKLFASKVGESEALTRDVIKVMDGIGRAVILIDEIEKSFSTNATSGAGDSGVSSRMFGSLISWMSLKNSPVFIIGTLNNHESIPPELLRKGRFDEIWWCDLPSAEERLAIFNALLGRRYTPDKWEIGSELLEATRDFTGAEIEAAIQDALYSILNHPDMPFTKALLESCQAITPQAQLDPTGLENMRNKAKSFKTASSVDATKPAALPATSARRGSRKLTV
jgi:AAA+ superfamily predicted ATPase